MKPANRAHIFMAELAICKLQDSIMAEWAPHWNQHRHCFLFMATYVRHLSHPLPLLDWRQHVQQAVGGTSGCIFLKYEVAWKEVFRLPFILHFRGIPISPDLSQHQMRYHRLMNKIWVFFAGWLAICMSAKHKMIWRSLWKWLNLEGRSIAAWTNDALAGKTSSSTCTVAPSMKPTKSTGTVNRA